jgi:galactose mutarotase-like enzyme
VKTLTIKSSKNSEVSFCPERGGIITSLKFDGKEVLYLDKETFDDEKVNVKGGIPILFPNFGPIESPKFPGLKQHGFARNSSKWKYVINQNSFIETLISDSETLKSYPYHFKLSISGKFEADGSFSLHQEVENLEKNKTIPVSFGLHPYFKSPANKKNKIKFNFEGGKYIEEQNEAWANNKDIYIDNPKVPMRIDIPELGTLIMTAQPEYKKIWIWSQSEKDYICIEPVMRKKGGLIDDPEIIKPGETFSASVNFSLKIKL